MRRRRYGAIVSRKTHAHLYAVCTCICTQFYHWETRTPCVRYVELSACIEPQLHVEGVGARCCDATKCLPRRQRPIALSSIRLSEEALNWDSTVASLAGHTDGCRSEASNTARSIRHVCCVWLRRPRPFATETAARVRLDRSRPRVDPQFSPGSHTTGPLQWLRVHGSATVIRRPTRIHVGPAVVRFVHSGTERCDCSARSVLSSVRRWQPGIRQHHG